MPSSSLQPNRAASQSSHTLFYSPMTQVQSSPAPMSPLTVGGRQRNVPDEHTSLLEEEDGDSEHDEDIDEEDAAESSPLLPIFSAPHLDSLPTYHLTHTIRLLISARCETTLSWDQLRSPQVSRFLLKPIQQELRTSHFSRATLYALMANCLQFKKEVVLYPGNSGASKTRAMVSELLAIKLSKEYTTRELIDALSYDFYPLQGQTPPTSSATLRGPGWDSSQSSKLSRAARISCLEIAIRAHAKRFLAHPLVVQQLEAIWAGTIVFHSAADNLHRLPSKDRQHYGSTRWFNVYEGTSRHKNAINEPATVSVRRSVTLYDPRDASLFKLSRLRVPRYRQFLSTLSFAILLGLFLAVVKERSLSLTPLEVVFWFWSAGFMLDEIVGFNEQGFSLYLMSFWNTFDLGILLMLFCYYCLRIYGAVVDDSRREDIATLAYDVLAANAVLLLPRLFSVLDHYRYFSQLLIAFRMMAADLVAVFVLIVIACSGFFVTFTFSSTSGESPGTVIYALFQMVMGFTPAAWQLWDQYHPLGKAILTLFLFICHFLVVTILITVLTNSFMAIVQNANEEHQFVFAVNTISMVKSDALFSYVAPTNVLAWLITPLRFVMPFRKFIKLNRTVIKITHMPILFTIYLYERTILRSNVFESTDLVDRQDRPGFRGRSKFAPRHHRLDALTTGTQRRVREPSVTTHQKDQALEEVFRRPFNNNSTYRGSQRGQHQRGTTNVVNNWMQEMDTDGEVVPPEEQDHQVVEQLEAPRFRRPKFQNRSTNLIGTARRFTETTRSVASDPEDFLGSDIHNTRSAYSANILSLPRINRHLSRNTDMDGDDELTSGDDEHDDRSVSDKMGLGRSLVTDSDNIRTSPPTNWGTATPRLRSSRPSTAKFAPGEGSPLRRPRTAYRHHTREASGATVLYNPLRPKSRSPQRPGSAGAHQSDSEVPREARQIRRSPKGKETAVTRPRAIMPPSSEFMSVPDMTGLWHDDSSRGGQRPQSSFAMDIGSDLGDNRAAPGGFLGAVPSSFATQMAFATGGLRRGGTIGRGSENQDMLSKLVLARMKTLEEGFQEVIKEVKDLRREGDGGRPRSRHDEQQRRKGGRDRKGKKEGQGQGQKRSQGGRNSNKSKPASEAGSGDDDASRGEGKGRQYVSNLVSGSV